MNKKNIALMIVVAVITIFGVTGTTNAFYIGQTGSDIADLQITLIEAGFDIPAITSGVARPGYFGPQTQKALAAYEASKASGIILGAVTGPDTYFDYTANNGVQVWTYRSAFANATTTRCSFKLPAATSTIDFAGLAINVGTTSVATIWTIATSTSPSATTTPLTGNLGVAAGLQGNAVYRGATGSGLNAPNTYLNFGVAGTNIQTDSSMRGSCLASVRTF